MSIEITKQNEVTLAYLEREREQWLPHYHDAQVGKPDAQTRADFFMHRIDALLEELIVLPEAGLQS